MPKSMNDQQPETTSPIKSEAISPAVTGGLTALGLLAAIYAAATMSNAELPITAKAFMVGWLSLSVAVTFFLTPRNFTAGFLIGLLTMLMGWRIAGLLMVDVVAYMLIPSFIAFVLQFLDAARSDLQLGPQGTMTWSEWQLTFIRIYVGFNIVPHFTEKLFAGPIPFMLDVGEFTRLGLSSPEFLVILGGLCEVGIAIGVGLGLLTRLAAPCAAVYYLIATVLGRHFGNGFIWVNPGGGWEYSVLIISLYLSFTIWGAGKFSLDYVLNRASLLPTPLRVLTTRT